MPTAIATTMSSGGSLDDTMRNTTSRPAPDHSTRRDWCDSHGPAMITSAIAAAMSGEVAKAGSVSSTTRSVVGSTAAIQALVGQQLGEAGHRQPRRHRPVSSAAARRNRRRASSTTSAITGTTPAPITASPVSTSANRSGTRS